MVDLLFKKERPHVDGDPNKPQLYWDGFQWVIKPNSLSSQTFDVIKPGRKVQIANLPLHLNITAIDLKDYLIKKVEEKEIIQKDEVKNINNIIRGLEIDFGNNSAVIALESTEIAKKIILLDGISLLGHTIRFSPWQDLNNNNDIYANYLINSSSLANTAQLSAKSAAIAFAAFKSISKNEKDININLNNDSNVGIKYKSKVIKIMNMVDPDKALKFTENEYEELYQDIRHELRRFGDYEVIMLITKDKVKLGCECGSAFIQFKELDSAEKTMMNMKGRRYMGRSIKMSYLDEDSFKKDILEEE
jgi:hypothetical protein